MNRILALDPAKEVITLEPGATFDKVEQTLYTHGLFLPPYPVSQSYATIGGGLANNCSGEKSIKYGSIRKYAQSLRVVLANGEVIETGVLSKRELSKKLGQANFEGEIYRTLDVLLEDNANLIKAERAKQYARRNSAGYNIFDIKSSKGFDLTPLIVGSQGTLGIITEAIFKVVTHNPLTSIAMVSLYNQTDLADLLPKIIALRPSQLDMVNRAAIENVRSINPHQIGSLLEAPEAQLHLFIEFTILTGKQDVEMLE